MLPTLTNGGGSGDPLGIGQAFGEVHHAWGQHPAFLLQRMEHLRDDYLRLWVQGWQRLCGIEVSDAVPAVQFDERFQEVIWTEHPWFDLLKEYYLAHTRWLEDSIEETPDLPWKTRARPCSGHAKRSISCPHPTSSGPIPTPCFAGL